jgi:dTDP-4-amino-4,6-dideoxygalactose transaminase
MSALPKAKGSPRTEPVPFQDLYPANRLVEQGFLEDAARLYRESAFSGGPYVQSFEKAFARYLGAPHCLGLNSGTSAIHLALAALGIGPGDEVIVPAFTFVGSAWGILYCGAKPVFADVEAGTACLDPESLAAAITPKTKAVIVVHLFGRPAPLDRIQAALRAARKRGGKRIALIEDAAQAHGAVWKGRQAGTIGDVGCFSFYPSKNLGAAGEAGAVVTRSAALAERIARLRNHGQKVRYRHETLGFNYRMDGLQGLFLEKKLPLLDRMNADREGIAAAYLAGISNPRVTPVDGGPGSARHLFVCRVPRRKAFLAHLDGLGIGYGIHYPLILPELPPFQSARGNPRRYPASLALAREVVSLPIYYGMPSDHVERVIDAVESFR